MKAKPLAVSPSFFCTNFPRSKRFSLLFERFHEKFRNFANGNLLNQQVMPEISKFFGIIVSLYWRDHNPPHIHFTYGEYECSISVLDRVVDGKAPSKVIAKVNEWMDLHESEILTLWEKAQKGEKIGRIEPLK